MSKNKPELEGLGSGGSEGDGNGKTAKEDSSPQQPQGKGGNARGVEILGMVLGNGFPDSQVQSSATIVLDNVTVSFAPPFASSIDDSSGKGGKGSGGEGYPHVSHDPLMERGMLEPQSDDDGLEVPVESPRACKHVLRFPSSLSHVWLRRRAGRNRYLSDA